MKHVLINAGFLLILGVCIGIPALFIHIPTLDKLKMINSGDTAWVIVATALVMLMTPAVGFFYGGMVKHKNVISVLQQTLAVIVLVSLQWVIIGYSLVFGKDAHGLIGGMTYFLLNNVGYTPNPDYAATIPHLAFMMFQAM